QAVLAEQSRVCSYDRAGYGWSDFDAGERNSQVIANDLLALLDVAGITEPVTLVGFSFSGLHTRLIAIQHPERVNGLILLDPALENDSSLYSDQLLQQQQSLIGLYGLFGSLAEVGLVRALNPEEMAPSAPFIPQGQSERYYARLSAPEWWYVSQQEFSTMITGESATIIESAGNLPTDLPLIVIGIDTYPEGFPEDIPANRTQNLQALVAQSELGQYWVAEGVLHESLIDEQTLIIEAIEWVNNPTD
ncbi:MAG: alpha/beta hydrolase, partial [Chloroflexota bacterium]